MNGIVLKNALVSGANNISSHKSQVDDLNIFPVPDGDTGTNMSMTITAAARELENIDDENISAISKIIASAMLRGARGNSGVITSLLFRGFPRVLSPTKPMPQPNSGSQLLKWCFSSLWSRDQAYRGNNINCSS